MDVEVIDYRPRKAVEAYNKHLFGRGKPRLRNAVLFAKMRWFLKRNLKLSSQKVYDGKLLKQFSHSYDAVICGSDEVWNINSFRGFDPAFFLDFVDKTQAKKSSYAASFGFTSTLEPKANAIASLLQEFSCISVRDSNSKTIASEICSNKISKVLDPTFLIQEHYSTLIQPIHLKRKYILIYGGVNKDESKIIYTLAQKLDLDIISIGSQVKVANRIILDVDPTEWLSFFKSAEFIFTEFYHGTIFSIIFKKPFYVLHREAKYIKIDDLLIDLGLEKRVLKTDDLAKQNFTKNLNNLLEPIDYLPAFQYLNNKLDQSTKFLSTVFQ